MIEETSNVLTQRIEPELRAIYDSSRQIDSHVEGVKQNIADLDRRVEQRHESLMSVIRRLVDYTEVQDRFARRPARVPLMRRTMAVYE